jgi:hypothetical protein
VLTIEWDPPIDTGGVPVVTYRIWVRPYSASRADPSEWQETGHVKHKAGVAQRAEIRTEELNPTISRYLARVAAVNAVGEMGPATPDAVALPFPNPCAICGPSNQGQLALTDYGGMPGNLGLGGSGGPAYSALPRIGPTGASAWDQAGAVGASAWGRDKDRTAFGNGYGQRPQDLQQQQQAPSSRYGQQQQQEININISQPPGAIERSRPGRGGDGAGDPMGITKWQQPCGQNLNFLPPPSPEQPRTRVIEASSLGGDNELDAWLNGLDEQDAPLRHCPSKPAEVHPWKPPLDQHGMHPDDGIDFYMHDRDMQFTTAVVGGAKDQFSEVWKSPTPPPPPSPPRPPPPPPVRENIRQLNEMEDRRNAVIWHLREKRELMEASFARYEAVTGQLGDDPEDSILLQNHEQAEVDAAHHQAEVAVLTRDLEKLDEAMRELQNMEAGNNPHAGGYA